MSAARILTPCLALFLGLGVMGGEARAQTSFTGAYVLDEAASEDAVGAFEPALERLNALVRTIARSRLRQSNLVAKRLHIALEDGYIVLQSDDRPAVRTPVTGEEVNVGKGEGTRSTLLNGSVLRQHAESDQGERTAVMRLSPDGQRLTMNVTITSPRLEEPVHYRLVYKRV
jgi:hypothetical protein